MKRMAGFLSFLVLVVLVGCVTMSMTAWAVPDLPNDVQIVEPDPSLPKELTDFLGKWSGMKIIPARPPSRANFKYELFIIVEKVDKERAVLYFWSNQTPKWTRINADVLEDGNKYSIKFVGTGGMENILSLREDGTMEYFNSGQRFGLRTVILKRVP
jgi:hypothetical protein